MGRNKFSESEIKAIAKLLRLKNAGNRYRQKLVRHGIGIDVAIMQDVQLTDDRETVVFALDDITIDGQHIDKYSTAIVSQSFFLEGRAAIARFR